MNPPFRPIHLFPTIAHYCHAGVHPMSGTAKKLQHASGVVVIYRLTENVAIQINRCICTNHNGRCLACHIYGSRFF
jgi:hypothetical protein